MALSFSWLATLREELPALREELVVGTLLACNVACDVSLVWTPWGFRELVGGSVWVVTSSLATVLARVDPPPRLPRLPRFDWLAPPWLPRFVWLARPRLPRFALLARPRLPRFAWLARPRLPTCPELGAAPGKDGMSLSNTSSVSDPPSCSASGLASSPPCLNFGEKETARLGSLVLFGHKVDQKVYCSAYEIPMLVIT